MNELGGYAFDDLRVGMWATFAKTITEADIVLFTEELANGPLRADVACLRLHAIERRPILPHEVLGPRRPGEIGREPGARLKSAHMLSQTIDSPRMPDGIENS